MTEKQVPPFAFGSTAGGDLLRDDNIKEALG